MKSKIVIAGGTGFIGNYLKERYSELGYEVIVISRSDGKGKISWGNTSELVKALNNSTLLVNLSGKSVDCRYTYRNKWKILTSRTWTTLRLHEIIHQCEHPPQKWINSSTATIYRHSEDRAMTEDHGEIGTGFSVHVAKTWEATFFSQRHENMEQIALRTAIVLGNGSAFIPLKMLAKLGFGGPQGDGKQKFSWIHIEDLFRIIRHIERSQKTKKIYNCSSPNPTDNNDLMKLVREYHGRKWYIPIPTFLLKIGAFFIRTETELVLKSRWVIPENLEKEKFEFKYQDLEEAIKAIP